MFHFVLVAEQGGCGNQGTSSQPRPREGRSPVESWKRPTRADPQKTECGGYASKHDSREQSPPRVPFDKPDGELRHHRDFKKEEEDKPGNRQDGPLRKSPKHGVSLEVPSAS
jgi:hypothetical protein